MSRASSSARSIRYKASLKFSGSFRNLIIFVHVFRGLFGRHTIPQVIRYCLDIDCNINDDGILPKYLCQTCLDKLLISHELKSKSKESEKYLKEILLNQTSDEPEEYADDNLLTPYNPQGPPNIPNDGDLEDLLEEQPYNQPNESNGNSPAGGYECTICGKTFKYRKPFKNHMKEHSQTQKNHYKQQAASINLPESETEDAFDDDYSEYTKGTRHGGFTCHICHREFKYVKPYKQHLKKHSAGSLQRRGRGRPMGRPSLTRTPRSSVLSAVSLPKRGIGRPSKASTTTNVLPSLDDIAPYDDQAPYDSLSPYNSPPRYPEENVHESSPDFASVVADKLLLNSEDEAEPAYEKEAEQATKRTRNRKQVLGLRPDTPVEPLRKKPSIMKVAPKPLPTAKKPPPKAATPAAEVPEDAGEDDSSSLFDGFCEVDVNSLLKKKASDFMDDSDSQSGPSSRRRRRSRSASVEFVHDFDIFGSPDKGPKAQTSLQSKTFPCDERGCTMKFHLRANLKKHQREAHNVKFY